MNYILSDNSLLYIQLSDTAGKEKFHSIIESYYKKQDCILLVYDISDRHSFDECKTYFCNKIKEKCKDNIMVILVGNKIDLEEKRKVSFEEGSNLAFLNNWLFIETSCRNNINVFDCFTKIIEISLEKNQEILKDKIIFNKHEIFVANSLNKSFINKLLSHINN